ncbi:MAG: hypothetical protein WCS69_02730 [Ignavibacteriaceae bacterium]
MEITILKEITQRIGKKLPRKEIKEELRSQEETLKQEVEFVCQNKALLVELVKNLFLERKIIAREIFDVISEIEAHLNFRKYSNELAAKVFIEVLAGLQKNEVHKILSELETPDNIYFWSTLNTLPFVLSEYKLDGEFAANLFYKLADRVKGDLAGGDLYKAIDNFTFKFPKEAIKIIDIYFSKEYSDIYRVLSGIVLGSLRAAIRTNHVSTSISDLEEKLKNSMDPKQRVIYLNSWITTYNRNVASLEEILIIINLANRANEDEISEVYNLVWRVITKDLNDEKVVKSLLAWLEKNTSPKIPPNAKFYVAQTLYWFATFAKPETIELRINNYGSILQKILPVESEKKGIWAKIEDFLVSIIRVNKNHFTYLLDIIITESFDDFIEMLNQDFFQSLENSLPGDLANKIFSNFLFSKDRRNIRFAFELFRKIEKITLIEFEQKPSEEELNLILDEFAKNILLAKNTSKFLLLIEQLFVGVSSALKYKFMNEMLFQAVNYPGACLSEWKKSTNRSELLTEVIDKAENYFLKINVTNKLPVICYTHYEFNKGAELERKFLARNVSKGVRNKSVLLNLIKHTQILYGDSWSFPGDIRGTAPNKFSTMSYEVEYPRIEILDPEGMVLKRMLINSKIGEK